MDGGRRASSLTNTFLFIHFNENLGIPTANIGYWAAFLALIEVPFFILVGILPNPNPTADLLKLNVALSKSI